MSSNARVSKRVASRLTGWLTRQAGGHWFEPSTAHLTKAPLRRGFLSPFRKWSPIETGRVSTSPHRAESGVLDAGHQVVPVHRLIELLGIDGSAIVEWDLAFHLASLYIR
jgi:hypothetical protein